MALVVPLWVERLLKTTSFFSICRSHADSARSERNMFCIDCPNSDSFCFFCRSSRHQNHRVIQIRRSSYHDVVRVSEVQAMLDISGVQTYVINSARVLFLNERPQPKSAKSVSYICHTCGRSLLDNSYQFCSLGCKLMRIKRNGDASFTLEGTNSNNNNEGGVFSSRSEIILREENQELYPSTPSPPPTNARRRKGIPHRAPFGS